MLVDGCYVLKGKSISKVPASASEALASNLMGFVQKRKCKKFFTYCDEYKRDDPSTWKGFDLARTTMREIFKYFDLSDDTIDFVRSHHGVVLER
eukprot:EC686262.1.p1 GENE.EC686262.1~~EC686262.1.p1  ORF type:complete len:94 (+),score=44.32 EC686262.1:265-546(+)